MWPKNSHVLTHFRPVLDLIRRRFLMTSKTGKLTIKREVKMKGRANRHLYLIAVSFFFVFVGLTDAMAARTPRGVKDD
jgi:hypothetical protein